MSPTELHIAALPFPSYQGTQAAIRSMLEARYARRMRAELFTYGARGYAWAPKFAVHRGPDDVRTALRSGPSWAKVFADVRMARALPALCDQRNAQVLIAHHVEAMGLTSSVRTLPRVFFAHTDLAAELPCYAAPRYARILEAAGAMADRVLCMEANAIAAISPALCEKLRAATGLPATYVPTPWPVPEPIHSAERRRARHQLGLAEDTCVALYAGNLDAYQAAEQTLAALEQLALSSGPRVTMLLATNSQPERFLARAVQLGVPFRSYALGDEPIRRLLHAAADLAIVPRATPGGLPMKLLDALARGTPCALAPLAAAGLALQGVTEQATAPGHKALADSIARLTHRLGHPEQRRALADRARAYVANEHRPERFHAALDKVIAQAKRDHQCASGSVRSVNVHDGSHRSNNIHTPSSAAAPKHVRSHFVRSHDE